MEWDQSTDLRTLIVAEIGQIHDGSLGECYRLADAAAAAGADAVKCQYHLPAVESTAQEQFPKRFNFHPQDRTRASYWARTGFYQDWWMSFAGHVRSLGCFFGLSCFSRTAVESSETFVDFFKVPSGQLHNESMLYAMKHSGVASIVVSTGFHTESEIDACLMDLGMNEESKREQFYVLQCCTQYPTPLERVGLNMVERYSRNMNFLGGLSDHSGSIFPPLAAAVLGAHMLEVHICWDKRQFGCDAASSLTISEFEQLCRGVRQIEACRRNPVDKDALAAELKEHGDVLAYVEGKKL